MFSDMGVEDAFCAVIYLLCILVPVSMGFFTNVDMEPELL